MRIYRLANIIAIPFLVLVMGLGYLTYLNPKGMYMVGLIFPIACLILIYLFSPQINYWWLSKNPVKLDEQVKTMLKNTNPVYNQLSSEDQQDFENRLVLFSEAREYSGKGMEEDNKEVPYDIKHMISQVPLAMSYYNGYKWKNWERIVLYKHPFPSPRFKFLHTSETEAEDGVVILSLEHVERALFQKHQNYNITWHAYAEAYIKSNPKAFDIDLPSDIWASIDTISPVSQKQIYATLGYQQLDAMPVLVNLYFNYRKEFEQKLPELFKHMDENFVPNKI